MGVFNILHVSDFLCSVMQVIASVTSSACCKLVEMRGRVKTELSFLKWFWKQVVK